jgi:hypothetical protein
MAAFCGSSGWKYLLMILTKRKSARKCLMPTTYNPDVKYSELFAESAREARSSNTGLWGVGANGTTKGDLDSQDIEGAGSSKEDQGSGDKTAGTVPNEQESFKN